jgi:hypothetical protein
VPQEPFIKLDPEGQASVLNYNLPQATCYKISSNIGFGFPESWFNPVTPPPNNFWDQSERQTKEEWAIRLRDELNFAVQSPIFGNKELLWKNDVIQRGIENKPIQRMEILKESRKVDTLKFETERTVMDPEIAGMPIDEIADKIKKGYKPVLERNIMGTVKLMFVRQPVQIKPEIIVTLKLKSCSYLGDYGAGQTLKTFSLLPGEKTTITIRNWERNETTKKETSSVLDSLTESSANELQTIVNQESSTSLSEGSTVVTEMEINADVSVNLPKVNINVDGGISNSQTFTSALETNVSNLVNSTSTQVSKADSLRQVEINTETSSTNITETEETVVRTLENINKSRVLNFVFRQLLQEYFTITYLDDVSITYSTGYKEQQITTNLAGLQGLLKQVITDPTNQDKAYVAILNRLSSVLDYTGTKQSFIECVEETLETNLNCSCIPTITPETTCFIRKKKDLSQTYNGKEINGIILDVTHRIVRTPALVVDALLGQGEALDCFNQQLQNEAVKAAQLANELTQQQIKNIEYEGEIMKTQVTVIAQQKQLIDSYSETGIEGAVLNYKKVFGPCCDVPQVGCGCGTCSENSNPKP